MKLIDFSVSTTTLTFDPVKGRRTWYISLTICNHTWWAQRWDVGRAPTRLTWDGLMGWTFGHRKPYRAPASATSAN